MGLLKPDVKTGLKAGAAIYAPTDTSFHKARKKNNPLDKDVEKPPKTAEELALENRQKSALDKQIEEQERRMKSLSRGRTGSASMLGGIKARQGGAAKSMLGSATSSPSGSVSSQVQQRTR